MNVEAQTQEQVPNENVAELTARFERVDARLRALDLALLETEQARCERAVTAASVESTINPSPATLAALAAAKVELERAREQLARRGPEVLALEEARKRIRYELSAIRNAATKVRVDAAMDELKALLAAKHDVLEELAAAMLLMESLKGGRPWPHEVGIVIEKHGGIDLPALCKAAQGRANAIRNGEES